MEVRILGPLEAVVDDEPLALGAPKERTLFALLALQTGRVVSLDRLADELWNGDPPEQATSALRVYVSHLRKALPDGRLVTREPGYLLQVPPDGIDAQRFDALVRDGRARLAAGDPSGAAVALECALGLWRGDPFEDVAPTPSIAAEATRLQNLHLDALEDGIEAALQTGRHREVLSDLGRLVAEHPLRERLWGQLILALYRSGRQADALRAYQQARDTLVEELGIEPGVELKELETKVLAHDPQLAIPVAATAIRTNLPSARTSFIGRERERAHVIQLLHGQERLVTLTGVGGCGKTRLAIEVARSETVRFPDGVFLVELAGVADPALVASTVAATIGVDVSNLEGTVAARLSNFLSARTVLIVLDNCEHLIDGCASLLDEILDRCERVRVLATSRESIGVEGERSWRIPSLSLPAGVDDVAASDAAALFIDRATIAQPGFQVGDGNAAVVAQICRRLDGIPLALELAAARLRMMSLEDIAKRLDDRFHLLTGRRSAVPRQQTLEATMDWSYELLDEDDRILLRRLGVFVGGFTLEAAEAIAVGTMDGIGRLIDKSLVTVEPDTAPTRYLLLETVRQYALAKLYAAGETELLRRRHLDWCLDRSRELGYFATTAPWARLMTSEYDNYRAALDYAFDSNDIDAIWVLITVLALFWFYSGRLIEGLDYAERASTMVTPGGSVMLARCLARLGLLRWVSGFTDDALAASDAAVAMAIAFDDRHARAETQILAASLKVAVGLLEEGCAQFRAARDTVDESDAGEYSYALLGVGFAELFEGNIEQARTSFDDAIEFGAQTDNLIVTQVASTYRALVSALLGDRDDTRARIAAWREQDWSTATARFAMLGQHTPMGTAALFIDDLPLAEELARESLVMLHDIGATMNLGDSLALLAVTTSARGAHPDAACLLGAATRLGQAHGDNIATLALASHLEHARSAAIAALGQSEFERHFERGRLLQTHDVIGFDLRATTRAATPTAAHVVPGRQS